MTIFAAAASAATQSPPATLAPAMPPFAGQRDAAGLHRPDRSPTVRRFVEPGVDGGQIWL